ncbi:hypothetical protein PCANC_25306 [Puccinia coronata f. sp. avenae]|uniref:Uncharacterized protein n=1 Tax=Puccinia coronata f. sp. avenae TaxID=200324 RepID=A0A2N5THI5_9BASI|nr:hypothetical protein PCANC_25306 [Puccinia coronata f. sp. avenae]
MQNNLGYPTHVHPSENFELIQHYLKLLRLLKEQELANYQPSAWELLSHKEKLEIVNKRLILREEERITNLLYLNLLNRKNKEKKILFYLEAAKLAKMSATSNSCATTPSGQTEVASANNSPINQSSQDFFPLPQEASAHTQLEERVNSLKLQMITRKETAPQVPAQEAMDLDHPPSTSLANTQTLPKLLDIQVLNKEEKIKLLVKEHILLWNQSVEAQTKGATEELKVLLNSAQETQKSLQKLIPRKEVEEYVKGWNPWKVKAEIFPSPKGKGKKRSSSSQEMRGHYNNPQKWKQLTSLGKTLMSAYNSM